MTTASSQRGFAAIAAIFLVVGLAALGAFMVSISTTQQLTSAQDVQGSRAYWAARAGLEWAIGKTPTSATTCWAPTTFTVDVFTVTSKCNVITVTDTQFLTDTIGTVYIFQLTSTATSSGGVGSVGYIERSVSASLERP